jgi:putative ABC transport system permease protein
VFLAEPQFFKMFNFSLAAGNIVNAVNSPNTVLLTKNTATKYFGDWKSAMGKTLSIFGLPVKVTGILNNPPSNTDFPLRVVMSYATLTANTDMGNWGNIDDQNYCFVQLDDNYSRARFNTLLTRFTDKHIKPVNPGYDLSLQPLNEIHYDERYLPIKQSVYSGNENIPLGVI